MREKISPLFKLYYDPLAALGELAARPPYLIGALLAFASTVLYYNVATGDLSALLTPFLNRPPRGRSLWMFGYLLTRLLSSAVPLIFLALVFVPACIVAAQLFDHRLPFRIVLRRDYGPLAACALYAWAAAHLLMLVPAYILSQSDATNFETVAIALSVVPWPHFLFLMALALGGIVQLSLGRAVGAVLTALLSLVLWPVVTWVVVFVLSSPFLMVVVMFLLWGSVLAMLARRRAREEFRQNLETATLNPADASAHYNLGLLHQRQGQIEEAKAAFRRAIEIDDGETDAHYQLGRMARREGRLGEAIQAFDAVVQRDPQHSQDEIWREIGRTYFQAGQFEDARGAFERFLENRQSDAEGLYFYGLTLDHLGRRAEAAETMRRCIEAVQSAPAYKYRTEKRWLNEAQAFLRSQSA